MASLGLHLYSNFHHFLLHHPRVLPEPEHKHSHIASTLHKCLIIKKRLIIWLWLKSWLHRKKKDCRLWVPSLTENAVKCLIISSALPFPFRKLLLNFLNELQDIIRIPICEASVTKLRSQRQRPVPRKWKCHSHPVSVCELALFLAPVWLGVWLLRVCMRRLINTNPVLNQIWEGTGRYTALVSDLAPTVSQYHNLTLCKHVEMQQCILGVRLKAAMISWKRV